MKKFFVCLLSVFLLVSLAACGGSEAESVSTAGGLTRKLENKSDKVIEVSEDIVLSEAIEIVGNKKIVGSGSITVSITDMEADYAISLADGASLTVGGSVSIDLSGLTGGIHVKENTVLTLQDEAVVTGASVKASNVLVEGTFTMNGGALKYANGHNLINKSNTTIAGGEVRGSGSKYASVYNEGTLTQDGGTIVGGYNNVVGVSGSSFTWNEGEIKTSFMDAIIIEEGAAIHITSADAKLTDAYAKGLVLNGEGVIDGTTMKNSMDSMIAVGKNGKLTLNGGKITEAGVHGIDNAGTLLMTDGTIFANTHSGICNTGTLDVTGGNIMNNTRKGVLNKAGTATIVSKDVVITGNKNGVSNEVGAYFELSEAEVIQNTESNVYAYGGEMYIHDIALSSSGYGSVNVAYADVVFENVDIQGTTKSSSSHGVYMTGGSVVAKNMNFYSIRGSVIRMDGEDAVFNGKNLTFEQVTRNALYVTSGTVTIDGLTTKDVSKYNVYMTGGTVNLANASLGKTPENNVRTKNDSVLSLKNVEILGNTEEVLGTVYGLIIDDGTVTASNLKIKDTYAAGIRMKGGTLTANKVTITNAGVHGINAAGGVIDITNLTTSNIEGCNVYMTKLANVSLTNAELGKCTDNSIKAYGKEESVLNLKNVTVLGHTEKALESVHGLILNNGTATVKNLKVSDVVSAGLRVRGGSLTAEDVTVSNAGTYGAYINGGTADITELKISEAKSYGVLMKGGTADITGLTTEGVKKSNIYVMEDSKLSVTDAELGQCNSHSIKADGKEESVLNLKNVTVLGHTENADEYVNGLMVYGGKVTATKLYISDVVSAGLRVLGGSLEAEGVEISDAVYAANVSAGIAKITGLDTSNVKTHNLYVQNDANLTVIGSKLGKCKSHSINVEGNEKAALELTKVTVLGHTEDAGEYVNGIIINNGSVTAKELYINDVVSSGVRVLGGSLEAEVVEVSDAAYGVYASAGTAKITDLRTSGVKTHNVYVTEDANLAVTVATLGTCKSHSINVEGNENAKLGLTTVTVLGNTNKNTNGLMVKGGSITAYDLEINGAKAAGIRMLGGSIDAEVVKISKAGTNGVYISGGAADITGLTIVEAGSNGVNMAGGTASITTLNTSKISASNIVMSNDAMLEVTKAELGQCGDNSIKKEGKNEESDEPELKLTDVTIFGHTEEAADDVYGVMICDGSVEANLLNISNVVGTGLYVEGGSMEAQGLNISDAVENGLHVVGGTLNAEGVTISNAKYGVKADGGVTTLTTLETLTTPTTTVDIKHNIHVTGNAQLTVTGAELGKSTSHSILAEGSDSQLYLTDVKVLGHTDSAGTVNGLYLKNGYVEAKQLEVQAANSSGVRMQGGELEGEVVTVSKAKFGVYVTDGTANIKNLNVSTATVSGSNGVKVTAGTLTLNGADVSGESYDIYNTTSTLKLSGVIKADVYNDEAVTINADSLAGSEMTVDWPEENIPQSKVGIQFSSAENASASASSVALGGNLANDYVPYYNGAKMMIVNKQAAFFTVTDYADFKEKMEYIANNPVTIATITLEGDIVIPETVIIPEGKDITLVDDGQVRNIIRDTTAFSPSSTSIMFRVYDNASLTFDSTGTDAASRLIVNGSKNSYTNISKNWSVVQSDGDNSEVNVNAGVKFIDNYSNRTGGVIKMNAGTLTVSGGIFSGNSSSTEKKGGVIMI